MSTCKTMNVNQNLGIDKPVRKTYIKNGQHKKFERNRYILIDQYTGRGGPEIKNGEFKPYVNQAFEKFNFKKTTARKYQWSCGGYGGKCSSCKSCYGEQKKFRKLTIVTQNDTLTIKMDRKKYTV